MTKRKYFKPEIEAYQLSTEVLSMVAATVTTKDFEEGDSQGSIDEGEEEPTNSTNPFL